MADGAPRPARPGDIDADVVARLNAALPSLSKKLALAARYALDHPDRIALDSMRTVATSCGVASPTMVRLARVLGFGGYDDFRGEFQRGLVESGFGRKAQALRDALAHGPERHVSEQIAQAATRNLSETMRALDSDKVDAFARAVRAARHVYVIGSGSMHWMSALMATTGAMALPGMRAQPLGEASALDAMAAVEATDVVLALSVKPYAKRTVEAARYAHARGAAVFAVTDRRSSPLASAAEAVFLAPTESPHYYPSVLSTVLIVEVLLAAAVSEAGSIERIKTVEAFRRGSGAYLD